MAKKLVRESAQIPLAAALEMAASMQAILLAARSTSSGDGINEQQALARRNR
ncbi:hypothetical protein [Burkholderia gladioli]|uniref:hypothetical protein n=1 Tax=Burkholderia gladioli TaxID=28095 RepID=UPI0018DEFC68|nr:hypothetical protein [Burkholderia gladioli]